MLGLSEKPNRSPLLRGLSAIVALALLWPQPLAALDRVTLKRDGREIPVAGKVLAEAGDGGLMLLTSEGKLWFIQPTELVKRETDETPFAPLSATDLSKLLLEQMPAGFEVYSTQHYLICHNASKAYAQWCGALFEQLYKAFTNYWSRQGFEIQKPEFPLVALVFADLGSYAAHAKPELGDNAASIIGYYSLETNRMTMYDLTGSESLRRPGDRRTTAAQINDMLSRPDAERTVATVVHEATHQIAYNCGLQTRYADIPKWIDEGVAVYFETPDLQKPNGWRKIGAVNRPRLDTFRAMMGHRDPNSLKTLIMDDQRFRDPKQANEAYAEAWALNAFLIQKKSRQYLDYFKMLSQKPRLVMDDPQTRLREFQQAFGENLQQLDLEFLRHMSKVR
jgi:hypothetical protein